jgi:rRNA maturation RNase YbeY
VGARGFDPRSLLRDALADEAEWTGPELAGTLHALSTAYQELGRHPEHDRTSLEELVVAQRPEVVIVATPPDSHAELCLAALEHGCHVVCEKPFVETLAEADRVLAAADAAGLRVAVNHEFREKPIFKALKEGIDSGDLGISFVCSEEIRVLKRDHLGIDEATDVLSFPIDGREAVPGGLPRQLGDMVVCPQVIGDAWRAPLVHGLLHLLGYDHGEEMSRREEALA